jgi:hypothetical protein
MRLSGSTFVVRPTSGFSGLALVLVALVIAGCGGASEAVVPVQTAASGLSAGDASPMPVPSPGGGVTAESSPAPPVGPSPELCDRIGAVQARLSELAALELRPTARVTLDIELSRVQAAFSDMRQAVLDSRGLDLDEALRRLGYGVDDLTLAVEDFRTTSRPREAADHVAEEAVLLGDALAGFLLLAGC